jgi:hypothetical protein
VYGGRHFLNPGSLGTGAQPEAAYALIELQDGRVEIEQCHVPYAREELLARYERLQVPAREVILKIFFGVTRKEKCEVVV